MMMMTMKNLKFYKFLYCKVSNEKREGTFLIEFLLFKTFLTSISCFSDHFLRNFKNDEKIILKIQLC